jgi:coenzyme F420-reducing hydrogenase gamma subunit
MNAPGSSNKPRIAVHKFSSCDGCQLALLNLGEALLTLAERVELVHFAEAGPLDPDTDVDVAFIEGSVSTPEDAERIQHVRQHTRFLIAIGACATAGGIQGLRNGVFDAGWVTQIYSHPEAIASLERSTPIASHVKVDFELWGCPVSGPQMLAVVNSLLLGVAPRDNAEKVCTECKRRGYPCVLVSRGIACMGPVTRAGCGALCPSLGRDCYGCYGPAENANTDALAVQFARQGLQPLAVMQRFQSVNNQAPVFFAAADKIRKRGDA